MNRQDLQANRRKTYRTLDRLRKNAYSGLTSYEYDMLKVCRDYIYMKYKEAQE